jgi:hypothetical protein
MCVVSCWDENQRVIGEPCFEIVWPLNTHSLETHCKQSWQQRQRLDERKCQQAGQGIKHKRCAQIRAFRLRGPSSSRWGTWSGGGTGRGQKRRSWPHF